MKSIKVLAPAKINLFLRILNKRRDGFHDIETVFEKISLFDKILIKEIPQDDIKVESNCREISLLGKNNTIYKAISLIKRKFRIKKGIYAYIEKNIPIKAGLGGGSSDAAATLEGLNRLWRLGLSTKELLNIAKNIGSDVPLFILKDSFLLGRGKGEKLTKIRGAGSIKLWHILINSGIKISTPHAYSLFDKHFFARNRGLKSKNYQKKMRLTIPPYSVNIIIHALFNRDVSLLNYYSYNIFEDLVVRKSPRLAKLKRSLEKITREFVHMTGSGSTLFMTFSSKKEASRIANKVGKVIDRCCCFIVSTY